MNNIKIVIMVLLLQTIWQGGVHAQNVLRIPLKPGYNNNSPAQTDDMTIEPVNLFIREKPWDGRNLSLQLELKITDQTEDHTIFLGYYEKPDDQLRNTFPKAFGKYLFDLDIRDDGVDLLVRTLRLGDEFVVDLKPDRRFVVESLVITYDYGWSAQMIEPDHRYGGYTISHLLRVSDGENEEILRFIYIDRRGKIDNQGAKEWKNYRIEILDDFREPLKLRVTENK